MQEYSFIRLWGEYLSSMEYYIKAQIEEARKDNAPERAIYKRDNGKWATIDDVKV